MDTRRQLKCIRCGATVEAQPGENFAFCEYCGGYSNPDGTVYKPKPNRRSRELKRMMSEALEYGDMESWRHYMHESCRLDLEMHPEIYRDAPADRQKLHEYLNKHVKQYELLSFDETIKKAFANSQRAINKLAKVKENHIRAAGKVLNTYRAYFSAFLYHPEYPFHAATDDAEQLAMDSTRAAINQYAELWGEEVISRIMVDVLGDIQTSGKQVHCDSCNFLLDIGDASSVTCPACGSVVYSNK